MFWSAQAVKGDVNFVGLLALSLQIFAGYYDWGRIYSTPQQRFRYKKLRGSSF